MDLIAWIGGMFFSSKTFRNEDSLSVIIIRILCNSRLLKPRDILSLAETSYSIFQYLVHYISKHFWFRLAPQPYVHYKPTKLKLDFESPYLETYIYSFSTFFPRLNCLDLVAQNFKYLLFDNDHFFLFHLSLTSLSLFGVEQHLGRLPPTLHTLVLRGTFKDLNFALQNLPHLTSLDIQGKKRGYGGMHASNALSDNKYISFLPPSLTNLSLPHNSIHPLTPLTLPPLLRSLHITLGHEVHTKSPRVIHNQPVYPSSLAQLTIHVPSLPFLFDIPPNLSHLKISSMDFIQELNDLPSSLTHLTIRTHQIKLKHGHTKHSGFDRPLNNLPLNLKVLKLFVNDYTHPLDNLPPSLTTFKFYAKSYVFPFSYFPPSLTHLGISIHHFSHSILHWPSSLQTLILHLPFSYNLPLPPFPRSFLSQKSFRHAEFECWCALYEVKRYHELNRHKERAKMYMK